MKLRWSRVPAAVVGCSGGGAQSHEERHDMVFARMGRGRMGRLGAVVAERRDIAG